MLLKKHSHQFLPKQIEDVIVKELPDRYMSLGRRNWMLLNKDVAVLQKNLHGKLPSKENVTELLHRVVLESPFGTNVSSTAARTGRTERSTDHRMSSQKRLLSEEYGIKFPTDKNRKRKAGHSISSAASIHASSCDSSASTCSSNASNCAGSVRCSQETQDFKLALKLQQEEMESHSPVIHLGAEKQYPLVVKDVEATENLETMRETDRETEMEFEANAAAALLQLRRK